MAPSLTSPFGPGTAHLCVDMQVLFSAEGPWPTPWMERVLPTVTRIAERAPNGRFSPASSLLVFRRRCRGRGVAITTAGWRRRGKSLIRGFLS